MSLVYFVVLLQLGKDVIIILFIVLHSVEEISSWVDHIPFVIIGRHFILNDN